MPVGGASKFAHLWKDESSQSPCSSDSSMDDSKEDPLKVTMGFLKSMDKESLDYLRREQDSAGGALGGSSLDYLRRDCDTTDLFASFGYDTSFGAVTSHSSQTPKMDMSPISSTSPGRSTQKYGVAERAFGAITSSGTTWPSESENAAGGSPLYRNVPDGSGMSALVNCSPFVPASVSNHAAGNDLCRTFTTPRKSDDLIGALGGMGCQGQLLSTPASNGLIPFEPKYGSGNSLTGLDAPLTSSPVSTSSVDTDTSGFNGSNHGANSFALGGPYGSLTQSLTYIACQLADLGFDSAQGDTSPRSPWNANRVSGFANMSQETMQKWIRILRNIQDTLLMNTNDADPGQKAQMLELSCTLQKQLLYKIVEHDSSAKITSHFGNGAPSFDFVNESHIQAAKFLREHAGFLPQEPYLWRGTLPRRDYQNAVFSCKVFLGGLPYDMTELGMIQAFKPFGNVTVEWPGKLENPLQHKGYAYIIFENEKQVNIMLQHCTVDYNQDGKWFCKMSSRRVRMKLVEVIPWALSDSNFAVRPTSKLESHLTIFVGALHGMLNAEGLAMVMEDLFGRVVHAGIDTDKNKYPIGSGRVSFDDFESYFTAINAAFVEIKSSKFSKVVQMDPYLQDANCSQCSLQQAPYFCRSFTCFRYYCLTCFELAHASEAFRSHRRMMRSPNKKSQSSGFTSPCPPYKVNYRTLN